MPLSADCLSDDVETLPLSEVADRLGVSVGRVNALITDRLLLAVRRGGLILVPELFFDDDGIARHLPGLLSVLHDGGFDRDESLEWLFTEQADLGLTPAAALHEDSAREVIRRAQAEAL